MKQLFLTRHGQDRDNAAGILNGQRDEPLTELGVVQSHQAAERALEIGVTVIYTSPLQRARQTGAIIGEVCGITPLVHADLIERNNGILTGKPISDIRKYAMHVIETDDEPFFIDGEGVELFAALIARARAVVKEIEAKHPNDDTVLLVSHGDIGKMIQAVVRGWTWEEALRTPYILNGMILELK